MFEAFLNEETSKVKLGTVRIIEGEGSVPNQSTPHVGTDQIHPPNISSRLSSEAAVGISEATYQNANADSEEFQVHEYSHRDLERLKVEVGRVITKVNADIDNLLSIVEEEMKTMTNSLIMSERRGKEQDKIMQNMRLEMHQLRAEIREKDKLQRTWVIDVERAYRSLQEQVDILRVENARTNNSRRNAQIGRISNTSEENMFDKFATLIHDCQLSSSPAHNSKKLEGNNSQWATCFKDWVQSAYFELLKFVFGVAVTLASQQASFLSPTNRYITEQQLLGNAIVVSSICTPVFFGLGLARARLLFDGAFAVFFASVAVQNLVGVFIDNEGPTGVVSYTPLSGTSLFNKSQAIVLPLFSFALAIRGQWLSSMKVHLLDDAKSEATRTAETAKNDDLEKKKSAQRRSTPYKVLFCLYGAGSYALGIYDASIVYGGYRCHELRTCARKRCDIASQPGMRLPFLNVKPSLLEKYGTFRPHQGNVENGESSFIFSYLMQSTQDASLPTGQAEWTVDQRSALKYTVDLVPGSKHDDGLPRVVLYVAEQSDQASTTRTVSSPSYNIGGKIKMRYGSSLKPCVSKFLVQCQELRPELAFEDKADPAEWVEYIDPSEGVFKLVLDTIDGVPDCWTADENKAGSAAGWWYDQLLFGPNITVGSTKSGEKILGFVMQNANFSSNSQQQGDPGQCIGGQQCGSAQSKSACNNIGAPCTWGAPNVNNLQRGMKFFSKVTYSIGYGRYSIFTDKWTSSDLDKHSMQKIPSQFMTTSYALDLKVPMLRWLECSDFETCSWSDPSQGGNNNNNGGNRPNSNNNGGPSNNNNGGNKPNPPPPGG